MKRFSVIIDDVESVTLSDFKGNEEIKMCKKLTVVYADMIGRRLVGWCAFNGKEFTFLSEKQVKARIQAGEQVNGLTLDAEGNVSMDGTFTKILMAKNGLTFAPIAAGDSDDGGELAVNKYFALVQVVKGKPGNEYKFVSNRCSQETFSETQVKAMLSVVPMGGVKLDGKGKVVVHGAVEIIDPSKPQGDSQGVTE